MHTYVCTFPACSDGFFLPNCSISCPFPSYGRRCLDGECNCSKESCDPRNGCVYGMSLEQTTVQCQLYTLFHIKLKIKKDPTLAKKGQLSVNKKTVSSWHGIMITPFHN